MKYEEMLKRGRDRIPETLIETARFEVPKIRGHIQGNKTIVTNLVAIADTLRRPPEHLLKYILKELATPGEFKKNLVIFGRKIGTSIPIKKPFDPSGPGGESVPYHGFQVHEYL